MRTLLGVLLAALAAGGCSIALDMDRFGDGDAEKVVGEQMETRPGDLADAITPPLPLSDGGREGPAPRDGGAAPKEGDAALDGGPPACTTSEIEPNGNQSNGTPLTLGSTTCGTIDDPNDADWFDYSLGVPTTVTIDSDPNVTATLWENNTVFENHSGGHGVYTAGTGHIQIWVVSNVPGKRPYRITLK